jgi:hypothetical protein
MSITQISSSTQGIIGYLHDLQIDKDSVLVFQLPRETRMISNSYIEGVMGKVKESLPPGRVALVIGADVNIYEIAGPDATSLILKGLLPC